MSRGMCGMIDVNCDGVRFGLTVIAIATRMSRLAARREPDVIDTNRF